MAGTRGRQPKLKLKDFYAACGSLQWVPRLQRAEKLQWLVENYDNFDRRVLTMHYGLLLMILRKTGPTKPMVELLLLITDESTITQSRVNLICDIYLIRNNSPSVGRLLQAISQRCPPHIYVPPLGQKTAEDAQIPINTALKLASRPGLPAPETQVVLSARICTQVYHKLSRPVSDIELAKQLATMLPLVEQSGRVFAAIERRIYEYLETEWLQIYNGDHTMVLYLIAAKLFRFWPRRKLEILERRLFTPLKAAQRRAAAVVLPHLWHFGPLSEPLVTHLLEKVGQGEGLRQNTVANDRVYMQLLLYYAMYPKALSPPSSLVRELIVRQPGYLFTCARWASLVPDICATLQGRFKLLSNDQALEVLSALLADGSADQIAAMFNINNSPWLGGYPQQVLARARAMRKSAQDQAKPQESPSQCIELINPTMLMQQTGLPYPEFYVQLLTDLKSAGLIIAPYLDPKNT